MNTIVEKITEQLQNAFAECGYDRKYAKVSLSNRPDLCEYQCNGAMAAAKEYKKAPFMIADEVVAKLDKNPLFDRIESVKPGFINIILSGQAVADYVNEMTQAKQFGYENPEKPKTVIVDYGGANAAKPLHVGHLRSAVIGESVKRIQRFAGNKVIGDVHLGDWGLQMGLIIEELRDRKPELPYFDEQFTGEYPAEAPFTISELEEIYPTASAKSKEDEAYKEAAMKATSELQAGRRGYQALLAHILNVSVTDLKKNYENLNVSFELWKGESDAQPYIPDMVEQMKKDGFTYMSDGALVVDVAKEEDLYNRLKEINKNKLQNLNNNSVNDNVSIYTSPNNTNYIEKNESVNLDYTNKSNSSPTMNNNVINESKEIEGSLSQVKKAKFPDLRIIGQFNKTYILAEYSDTLYIIDQHAAHEKILYEKYVNDIENGEIVVQQLLIPCLIDLSLDDYECYKENKEIFINSGFVIEEFGGNTISLKEVPYFLGKLDSRNFLLSIIDNLKNLGSGKTVEVKLNKIATMACKAAVKANDYLTQMEMEKLISDLRYIDNPFNCPHGRPIIIKFTEYELDKKFRRIV